MEVLVAPDKFKGTLSAAQVAAAIARGVRRGGTEAVEMPVADGGEGTMEALLDAIGGEIRTASVRDPLGRSVEARFAVLDDGTAVVEAAEASGLWRLTEAELAPEAASSAGTGELILATGASAVIVAAGGTATVDGGAGAAEALAHAAPVPKLIVACDARTPWEDTARVYGPQKGAVPDAVKRLTGRLEVLASALPKDPRFTPMTGCGGGLSGRLWAQFGAELVSGAALVLEAVGFDSAMRAARFVITGEGRLDEQTLAGKAVGEVATRCRQSGVACHAVVGEDALDDFRARVLDLETVTQAGSLADLEAAGRRLARS